MNNFTLKDLTEKVIKGISNYIEFDVNEIFEQSDYITIYGGSVRDSIAEKEIHDIDILCMPNSAEKLSKFIQKYNFTKLDLFDQDTLNMYEGLRLIAEPWTFINNNKKIIQIIRPSFRDSISDYDKSYINILKNVDISCCGVFLEIQDNELRLRESCRNGIIHCLTKTFEVNEWSKLYNKNRTIVRESKLKSRGWRDLKLEPLPFLYIDEIPSLKIERLLKITSLEFKPEYNYKVWKQEEYLHRGKMAIDDDFDLPF